MKRNGERKKKTNINALRTVFINFNFCLYYASVVLLDTTKEATLEWTRYPYGPQAQTPGVSSINLFIRPRHSLIPLLKIFFLFHSSSCSSSKYVSYQTTNEPCEHSGWRSHLQTMERASIGEVMLCAMLHIRM